MNARTEGTDPYADLAEPSPDPLRWVIWNTTPEAMVFDRDVNCPWLIDDEATLREVLGRMRAAGVPESDGYPGRRCS
ncbi:hypothetical protein [Streptomyces sp. NPDC002580]|uniref:hypothetical protein n=1 Tax=Streptomyces sp. NPDC002580 TaxID=3364653 RepID=UPI00368C514B